MKIGIDKKILAGSIAHGHLENDVRLQVNGKNFQRYSISGSL
jgi:hypothetical protein